MVKENKEKSDLSDEDIHLLDSIWDNIEKTSSDEPKTPPENVVNS